MRILAAYCQKALCLVLLITLLVTPCLAEELPEIQFRDAAFGTTIGQMRAEHNIDPWTYTRVYYGAGLDWYIEEAGFELANIKNEDPVLMEYVLDVKEAAGYDCSTYRYYVRPVKDGTLVTDDDQAQLFLGTYRLYAPSIEAAPDAVKDLIGKLSQLYGTPEVKEQYSPIKKESPSSVTGIWHGADDTAIILYWCDISNCIDLMYAWHGAQPLLDAAYGYEQDHSNNFNGL